MILISAGLGFLIWLLATGAFLLWGDLILTPGANVFVLFALSAMISLVIAFFAIRVIAPDAADRAEAAIGLAFPGMILDAWIVQNFQQVFVRIDPLQGQTFAAMMLIAYGAVVFMGLLMTSISARDERVG
jgi:hypothetical protein